MARRPQTNRENGKRAGRPKGSKSRNTLAKEAARELVRQMVTAELEPLVKAQIALAKGVKFLVVRNTKTGQFVRTTKSRAARQKLKGDEEVIVVWERDPSTPAYLDLMNRALDKPKEQVQEVALNGDWEKIATRLAAVRNRPPEG